MKKLISSLLVLSCFYFTAAHAQEDLPSDVKYQDTAPVAPVVSAFSDGEEKIPARSPWNLSYFGLYSVETKAFDYPNPSLFTYNYIGVNYRISKDTKLSLRIAFLHTFAGNDDRGQEVKQDTALSDAHIAYSDYDLFTLGPIDVGASFKFYFPTSETSQATHMFGKFRPEMYWEWAYGGYSSLTYVIKPDYYFQRQTAYVATTAKYNNDGSFVFDPRRTNKIATIEQFIQWEINMNKFYSFMPKVGFADEWYYGSEAEGLPGGHDTKVLSAIGVKVRPMRGLNFELSLQNNASATGQNKTRFWHPDDNQLLLITNAGLSTMF